MKDVVKQRYTAINIHDAGKAVPVFPKQMQRNTCRPQRYT